MADTRIYRTQTAGNTTTWTFSAWIKRCNITGVAQQLFSANTGSGNPEATCYFDTNEKLNWYNYIGGVTYGHLLTTRVFRDTGAWYHIVCVWDTGNATPGDRMKFWVNGVRETVLTIDANPVEDQVGQVNTASSVFNIGANDFNTNYDFDGNMSHVQFVDGAALAPTEFGSFDAISGIWKIKTGAYATPGTNGFCMKMEDRTNLDLDSSSNAHTFATTGTLTATYDNPSNNFCTQNTVIQPLTNPWTFTNGATTQDQTTTDWTSAYGTLGVIKGKWYYEVICGGSANLRYGWSSVECLSQSGASYGPNENPFNNPALPTYGIAQNGYIYYSTTGGSNQSVSYGTDFESDYSTTYLGVYLDLDNGKLYYAYNGLIQASGVGHTIPEYIGYTFLPLIANYNADSRINYGNGTFGSTALTGTTYSDDAGIGTFKYSPNDSGGSSFDSSAKNFYTLCTKNIKVYG